MDSFFAPQGKDAHRDDHDKLYCKPHHCPAQTCRIVICDHLFSVVIQEECQKLSCQNRVQIHSGSHAHHERTDGKFLRDTQTHQDRQDDHANRNDCSRSKQSGEDRCGHCREKHTDNDRSVSAQLNSLADQCVRNPRLQEHTAEPGAEYNINKNASPAFRSRLEDIRDRVHETDIRHTGIRSDKFRICSKCIADQRQSGPYNAHDQHSHHQISAASGRSVSISH